MKQIPFVGLMLAPVSFRGSNPESSRFFDR